MVIDFGFAKFRQSSWTDAEWSAKVSKERAELLKELGTFALAEPQKAVQLVVAGRKRAFVEEV